MLYIQSPLTLQVDQPRGWAIGLQALADDLWPAVARAALGDGIGVLV